MKQGRIELNVTWHTYKAEAYSVGARHIKVSAAMQLLMWLADLKWFRLTAESLNERGNIGFNKYLQPEKRAMDRHLAQKRN